MDIDISSHPLITVGISMPEDFPRINYEKIHLHCQPLMPSGQNKQWDEYKFAWNAVAYRFAAMVEHDENYRKALSGTSSVDRYTQEKELFGFFVTGLSTIEAFAYGTHFLLSIVHPIMFPINNVRKIKIKFTLQRLEKSLPSEPLTLKLRELLNDQEFINWDTIRNILAHRGAPGRHINLGSSEGDIWRLKNIPISPDLTNVRRKWLSRTLFELLESAQSFVENNLTKTY